MVVKGKIEHVDRLPNGVLRFRRKFPKDVREATGWPPMQVHFRNRTGVAFAREYETILQEFDRLVSETRERMGGNDTRLSIEKWHEALLQREGLLDGVKGLDEADARDMLVETLQDEDPMLMRALKNPEAPPPKVTLADALNLYRRDKQIKQGSKKDVDLNRVAARLEAALGDLDGLALEDMTTDHRRRYLNYMLNVKKADGSPLVSDVSAYGTELMFS